MSGTSSSGSMLRLVLGIVMGAVLGVAYVHWNVSLPWFLSLPGQLQDNIVSTAVEDALYDPGTPAEVRLRALELLFQSRSRLAAEIDRDAGHPFLEALHRRRAAREARELVALSDGFEKVLAQPGLREALERRHGTSEPSALKHAMLQERLADRAFLSAWLERNGGMPRPADLLERLRDAARMATAGAGAAAAGP